MASSRIRVAHPSGSRGARLSNTGLSSFGLVALLALVFCSTLSSAVKDAKGTKSFIHFQRKAAQTMKAVLLEQQNGHSSNKKETELETFLEVTRPVVSPGRRPTCSMQLLYHEFANTYGVEPPAVQYTPGQKCGDDWNQVVLKWSAVCRGRQFDRIAAVWLGGVEILRTCTAEPTKKGIIWEVEKDVTRYSSLWKKPQELVVAMGNVVDDTYTGIINVTVSVEFYNDDDDVAVDSVQESHATKSLEKHLLEPAQLILPIAESSYKDGGYWFQLLDVGGSKNSSLKIPRNSYRAVLEVCVSPHQYDEFWYTNFPNDFIQANNLTGFPGNGAFRDVQVLLDGQVVGSVWPFPVIYTGGIHPLFWRPLAAIGAFNLPSYDLDITPFVGSLLDGKDHLFSLSVTDNLDMWLLQANLHIWTDPHKHSTSGRLESSSAPNVTKLIDTEFTGLNGSFNITATRSLTYTGHVVSSFGNLTTTVSYGFKYHNKMVLTNSSDVQTVDQYTETENIVAIRSSEKEISMVHYVMSYPLYLYYSQVEKSDGSQDIFSSLEHSLKTQKQAIAGRSSSFSFLTDEQRSEGFLFLNTNNTLSGIAATNQSYSYEGTDGCYQRDVNARNYSISTDKISTYCSHTF
ncbi:hypothetical protein R1flu_027760 [Riccia fluitans]|uniref:Peptide N-acetyl-beta-D-glucosaminyl asparaginase amidase A N-terminal domain-containing protein n=1 Tax=Riccia fluitans TaxID=41844 RepID=A0ABD1XJQ6_9MARC